LTRAAPNVSPTIRLGDRAAIDLSPDGQWALAVSGSGASQGNQLALLPCGAGEGRLIAAEEFVTTYARFFPDGVRICVLGHESGHGPRIYVMDSVTGKYEAFSEEGIVGVDILVSPDGKHVAARNPGGR